MGDLPEWVGFRPPSFSGGSTIHTKNVLKLNYSNLEFQSFPGEDPGPPSSRGGKGGEGGEREGKERGRIGTGGEGREET